MTESFWYTEDQEIILISFYVFYGSIFRKPETRIMVTGSISAVFYRLKLLRTLYYFVNLSNQTWDGSIPLLD